MTGVDDRKASVVFWEVSLRNTNLEETSTDVLGQVFWGSWEGGFGYLGGTGVCVLVERRRRWATKGSRSLISFVMAILKMVE
jgi:hypothetical protein